MCSVRPLSAHRKLIPVAAVITRAVTVGVTDARAHNRAAIGRPVIVVVGRVIRGRVIITAIIPGYVWVYGALLHSLLLFSSDDSLSLSSEFPFFFRDRRFASAESELRRIRTILISQFPLSQLPQSEHHVAPTRPVRITSLIIRIVPCPSFGRGFQPPETTCKARDRRTAGREIIDSCCISARPSCCAA